MKIALYAGAFLVMVFVVFSILAYFYLGTLLDKAAYNAIYFVGRELADKGVEIRSPRFIHAAVSFPPAISIRDFSAQVVFTKPEAFQSNRNFSFMIDSFKVLLRDFKNWIFVASICNLTVILQSENNSPASARKANDNCDSLNIVQLQIPFSMNFFDTERSISQAKSLVRELAQFAKYGTTQLEMSVSGVSTFESGGKKFKGRLLFVPDTKGRKMVMDRDDFRVIAAMSDEDITEGELDVYANNPLRMAQMFRIRNYASSTAKEAYRKNRAVDEDAYRHILWSYLLTKAYGEKFATEATDAHETELDQEERARLAKGTLDEKNAMTRMDLINNLIGREYAKMGFSESDLLGKMVADSRVVRRDSWIKK